MRWEITLERRTKNRLNPDITQRKLRSLAKLAEQDPSLGFTGAISKMKSPQKVIDESTQEKLYVYLSRITVSNDTTSTDHKSVDLTFRLHILPDIQRQASIDGWTIHSGRIEQIESVQTSAGVTFGVPIDSFDEETEPRKMFTLPDLDGEALKSFFAGVYEREAHIRMIHDSMKMYIRSDGERRSHVLLEGEPASCKTTLLERFKQFYESDIEDETERVAFIDGPTMSKAGLENWMMQMAVSGKLPEIVCVEEIEKQNMDNLLTLLSVMGSGYIMKTNARIGRLKQLAKCVIWATCNDKQLLRSFRNGALWSRFTHKLHCKRPSRELMQKILHDEVTKCNGNPSWVTAIMDFAYEGMVAATGRPMIDPRAVLGLLDGGDRLLDGSYQRDYLLTLSGENGGGDTDNGVRVPIAPDQEKNFQNTEALDTVPALAKPD